MEPKIIAALLRKEDVATDVSELKHISNAERGSSYFCPDCKGELGVRKGEKNAHHFYHKSGFSCDHQGESYLHLLAKDVIAKSGSLWIPDISYFWFYIDPFETANGEAVFITDNQINSGFDLEGLFSLSESASFTGRVFNALDFLRSKGGIVPSRVEPRSLTKTYEHGLSYVSSVRQEYYLPGENIRPDLLVALGEIDLLIEIRNTHEVDSEKLKKIKDAELPCLEIDVRDVVLTGDCRLDFDAMRKFLNSKNEKAKWLNYQVDKACLHNEFLNRYIEEMNSRKRKLEIEVEERRKKLEEVAKKRAEQERLRMDREAEHKRIADEMERINNSFEKEGLPRLSSVSIKQLKYAASVRADRIKRFGKNDILVKKLNNAGDWCELHGQHLYPVPFKVREKIEAWIDEEKKCEEMRSLKLAQDRLWGNEDVMECPKCKSLTYELKRQYHGQGGAIRKCKFCGIFERE